MVKAWCYLRVATLHVSENAAIDGCHTLKTRAVDDECVSRRVLDNGPGASTTTSEFHSQTMNTMNIIVHTDEQCTSMTTARLHRQAQLTIYSLSIHTQITSE